MTLPLEEKKKFSTEWFTRLRDLICAEFEIIENEGSKQNKNKKPGTFQQKKWARKDDSSENGGGGIMSIMAGRVFEKVGVNISTVYGTFSPEFRNEVPGAEENSEFWAAGISIVAHMCSPLVPAVHMNTRFISTSKSWFGGGTDLTPIFPDKIAANDFHTALKIACDKYDENYYDKFKKWCDDYFYIPHRAEARGVGGIFYDYLDSGNWSNDFEFTKEIGKTFLQTYPKIVRSRKDQIWNDSQREQQLRKRGRYVEFNLLYDRGTKFGLRTGGNEEAILMSMPPVAKWP